MPTPDTAPTLPLGHTAVPPGHLAAVVTSLEMHHRPHLRPAQPFPPGIELQPLGDIDVESYRALIRAVGGDWLWFSRLSLSNDQLRAILTHPGVSGFALRRDGTDLGVAELDFRESRTCELTHFGVAADLIGTGAARTLMNHAIEHAWAQPIERFWVHTCTFDHPAAVDFYRRSGFTPFLFQVEVMPDPRLTGILPRSCSPHIPLLE